MKILYLHVLSLMLLNCIKHFTIKVFNMRSKVVIIFLYVLIIFLVSIESMPTFAINSI
jgi:hypothetical protein